MSRPKTEHGKRVSLSVKVSEAKAAAVDSRRGVLTRAAYLESLIDNDLNGFTGKPDRSARKPSPARRPAPAAARVTPRPDAAREVPFSAVSGPCPHPKSRVNKGLCGACGTYVGGSG